MTVMESQALTDLLGRAGASDADRDLWLAERAQGITATEIRDLVMGKKRQDDLIAIKLGRKADSFTGNHFTAWGTEREPIIAEGVRGMGIDPESRVFHGAQNSRHLASPDGIGTEFDGALVVSEIKTSGKDIRRGMPAYDETGYELQMQWAMWVTGADRCLFVFEERISVAGGFAAGQVFPEWVARDEEIIAALIIRADEFLAELDRQREDGAPVIDEELDTHAVNYLRAIDEEKRWGDLKREHYAAIVAAGKSQESPLARVTFTPEKPGAAVEVVEFDEEAAKQSRADVWAALHGARQKLASVEKKWAEVLEQHKTVTHAQGKGRAASARITAGKGTR